MAGSRCTVITHEDIEHFITLELSALLLIQSYSILETDTNEVVIINCCLRLLKIFQEFELDGHLVC